MIDTQTPYVEFRINDNLSGVDENSILVHVFTNNDSTGVFDISTCLEYNSGSILLNFENCGIDFEGSDSFRIEIFASDSPDTLLCPANFSSDEMSFWFEPQLPCSLTTNPFTPNQDGYNDLVTFIFPQIYSKGGKIEIFDLRGILAKTINVEPANLDNSNWNGKSEKKIDLPAGIYLYVVYVDGERKCKGTITLAR